MRRWMPHAGLVMLLALAGCDKAAGGSSEQNNAVAGGSSDQGNAIQVQVLDTAGRPLVGARVLVLPSDWIGPADSCLSDSACGFLLRSDSAGFAKGYVDSGRYAVTVESDWFASRAELVVDSTHPVAATIRPEPHLRLAGTAPNLASQVLFVPGSDRAVRFDELGRFVADSLPAGLRGLASKDGRRIELDSLVPGTVSYFGALPAPGSARAKPDSTRYLPPILVPVQGDGITTPLRVRVQPRVSGTTVEWARDSAGSWGQWSNNRGEFYVDSARQFWFRAFKPGSREGMPQRFTYQARVPVGRAALPLDQDRPTDRLQAWKPDSVRKVGDTLWIYSIANSCHSLPWHGVAAWHFEDTLFVYRRECPDGLGGQVRILMNLPSPKGIWTVSNLQPQGYTWEILP